MREDITRKFTFNAKEGIDNPVMVITDDTDPGTTPYPRLCVLKREQGESYGFFLRAEKERSGHIIRNIAPGGIAEHSGLRDGDRLLEVNCCFVDDVSHQEVSKKMKLSGNQISLLVLSEEEYEQSKSKGLDLKNLATVNKGESCKPPRLCHITKDPVSGLGITFTAVEGQKGHFSVKLVAGGAAEKAGVLKGDRLIWMGGATVEDLTHSAINRMLKKCGNQITILVVDAESEKYYNTQRIPILPAMATSHNLPYTARKLTLVPGEEGYGFLLRLEKWYSERFVHVLGEMDLGGPAEKAGMHDGDLLLEVNGEAAESLKHEEIVDRVRKSGRVLTLTIISPEGLDFYTKLGLPPLLFCKEVKIKKQHRSVSATWINEDEEQCGKSRLCTVLKGSLGFGFDLSSFEQKPGVYISQVVAGGPGDKAGLQKGDVVLGVNGNSVGEKTLEDVILLMKEQGSKVSLQVMQKSDQKEPEPETFRDEGEEEISYL